MCVCVCVHPPVLSVSCLPDGIMQAGPGFQEQPEHTPLGRCARQPSFCRSDQIARSCPSDSWRINRHTDIFRQCVHVPLCFCVCHHSTSSWIDSLVFLNCFPESCYNKSSRALLFPRLTDTRQKGMEGTQSCSQDKRNIFSFRIKQQER